MLECDDSVFHSRLNARASRLLAASMEAAKAYPGSGPSLATRYGGPSPTRTATTEQGTSSTVPSRWTAPPAALKYSPARMSVDSRLPGPYSRWKAPDRT